MKIQKTKRCPRCKITKILKDFYIQKNGRQTGEPSSYCKRCVTEYNKAYHSNNVDSIRFRVVRYRYGLSQEEYDSLSTECAICGSIDDLHIDHNHSTGLFRDILCGRCNRGLGLFKDDANLLIRATDYILKHF